MNLFLQTAAGVLLAVILSLVLSRQSKDWALGLTIAACCMVLATAMRYLEPVITFVQTLQSQAGLDSQSFEILLKAVGIGLIGEVAGLICQDSGNAALGKGLQILTTVAVVCLSLPLMESLLGLVQKILGEL